MLASVLGISSFRDAPTPIEEGSRALYLAILSLLKDWVPNSLPLTLEGEVGLHDGWPSASVDGKCVDFFHVVRSPRVLVKGRAVATAA